MKQLWVGFQTFFKQSTMTIDVDCTQRTALKLHIYVETVTTTNFTDLDLGDRLLGVIRSKVNLPQY